jgi:hypothetical protein
METKKPDLDKVKPIRIYEQKSYWKGGEPSKMEVLFEVRGLESVYSLQRESRQGDEGYNYQIFKGNKIVDSGNQESMWYLYQTMQQTLKENKVSPFMLIGRRGFSYGTSRTLNSYWHSPCVIAYAKIMDSYCIMVIKTAKKYMAYETTIMNGNLNAVDVAQALNQINTVLHYKPEGFNAPLGIANLILDKVEKEKNMVAEAMQKMHEESLRVQKIKEEVMNVI